MDKIAMEGIGNPDRNIDRIHLLIGDSRSYQEESFLEKHLPMSFYTDAGIIETINAMRKQRWYVDI